MLRTRTATPEVEAVDSTPAWHSMDVESVLRELTSDRQGLSNAEAANRLKSHGPNELRQEEPESPLSRFLRQFHDVLIYILVAAAAFTAFLGEWIDTGVILAVVIINSIIGFVQEGKAEAALASIRKMLSLEATVLRGGERLRIPARQVVPGDVVLLASGDRVPADLRVVSARNVRIEEAALTGESEPTAKRSEPVEQDAALGDRTSMAFSSTLVTSGRLVGVAVATGERSEIGRIGEMVSRIEKLTTPLLKTINRFGKTLSIVIVGLAALIFVFGLTLRDFTLTEMFLIVVSLAVAAIPEGLPAIITITLALGVQRMARQNAIIRRLPAVETLGSVTVICSDKTGTLTRNEITVQEVVLADRSYGVTGTGYAPTGHFERGGRKTPPDDTLLELARTGLLCSDATVRRSSDDHWTIEGDPTEGAVVTLGMKAGFDLAQEKQAYPRIDEIPFESEQRFMATLNETPDGQSVIYLKGAPEQVLSQCDFQRTDSREAVIDPDYWHEQADALAAKGQRVLALAVKQTHKQAIDWGDVDDGFTLLGLVGMIDPPRPEAIAAVEACQSAGIKVKMITGDHALTASAIGRQLGIGDSQKAITGTELQKMSDEEMERVVLEYDIFARSSPEHKLRLVKALQRHGDVVSMTGDGVNDAPALKRADVGVAMGIKGTEAAKEAAEMVLADDNFASIKRAVEEGRTVYDNLKKTILFVLPTNGAEALIVIATVLFAFDQLPITPVQILWVNMITAVTLALALAFEPTEKGVMRRPPRDPKEPILSGYLIWRISFVSLLIAFAALWLFFHELETGLSVESARTVAVNVLVAGQLFYLFNSRFIMRPALSLEGIFGNRVVLLVVGLLLVFQMVFTYAPPMQLWFGTEAIGPQDWLFVVSAGLGVFLLVEIEKALVRRFGHAQTGSWPGHRG